MAVGQPSPQPHGRAGGGALHSVGEEARPAPPPPHIPSARLDEAGGQQREVVGQGGGAEARARVGLLVGALQPGVHEQRLAVGQRRLRQQLLHLEPRHLAPRGRRLVNSILLGVHQLLHLRHDLARLRDEGRGVVVWEAAARGPCSWGAQAGGLPGLEVQACSAGRPGCPWRPHAGPAPH